MVITGPEETGDTAKQERMRELKMLSNPLPNDENQLPAAPPFTPQPPPKGLGVARTLILVLMGMVGMVELVLFLGLYLAHSLPSAMLPSGMVSQSSVSQVAQSLPVNAEPVNPSGNS